MRLRFILTITTLAVAAMALSGCAEDTAVPAATIGDTEIARPLLDDLVDGLLALPVYEQDRDRPEAARGLRAEVLTAIVIDELITVGGQREGLTLPPLDAVELEEVAGDLDDPQLTPEMERYRVRRDLATEAVLEHFDAADVSDDDIRMWFGGAPLSVQHVLVDDAGFAAELRDELADGADFAAVAEAHSQDPGSAAEGGDLGPSVPSMFVDEFAAALDEMEVGDLSGVVATEFGYHIIQRSEDPDLDVLAADLADEFAREQWIDTLVAVSADLGVTVDPDIGVWDGEVGMVVMSEQSAGSAAGTTGRGLPPSPVLFAGLAALIALPVLAAALLVRRLWRSADDLIDDIDDDAEQDPTAVDPDAAEDADDADDPEDADPEDADAADAVAEGDRDTNR